MWTEFLNSHKISEVLPPDYRMVSVQTDQTIFEALRLMKEKHIQSVPVFDVKENRFVGHVSLFDIISTLVLLNLDTAFEERGLDETEVTCANKPFPTFSHSDIAFPVPCNRS